MINGRGGFWQASLGPPALRPPLDGSIDADVCIVGAGYTGLWTAWALARAEPALRIAVVEAEHAGFGASGRNGGWLSGLMPGDRARLARDSAGRPGGGPAGVVALQRHLIDAVGEVVKACAEEGIDADIHLGGTLGVATTPAQLSRLRASLTEDREWGLGEADEWELSRSEVESRLVVAGATGGVYSPHCARIHPAKLARGLAGAVERRGVTIYEQTRALTLEPGRVRTAGGDVRAPWVVRATEGFTATLPGQRRRLLPMNSSMIVTDPLPPEAWARLGWEGAETFRDGAHLYAYAQRTADGRIAIGGRGVPYRFGSRIDVAGTTPPATANQLSGALRRLFPGVGEPRVAHVWSGVLGVARDWCPAVGVEPAGPGGAGRAGRASGHGSTRDLGGGLAWAGGYVGDGVTTSHLAGLTLADLILGRDTARCALPWVGHTSRAWEAEPLRWLGVRGVYALYRAADRAETRRPALAGSSRWAGLADRISGRT
jgi:glycine/D-amino acid oxidase-like deaminating enzyme